MAIITIDLPSALLNAYESTTDDNVYDFAEDTAIDTANAAVEAANNVDVFDTWEESGLTTGNLSNSDTIRADSILSHIANFVVEALTDGDATYPLIDAQRKYADMLIKRLPSLAVPSILRDISNSDVDVEPAHEALISIRDQFNQI